MSAEGSQGRPYRKLGELLVAAGVIDELQLKSALGHQRQWGGRIGHILLDLHFIDDLTLARTLAEQLGLEMIGLRTTSLDVAVVRFLPQALAERLLVFPVSFTPDAETGGVLTVAFSDPTNLAGLDEVRFQTGKVVIPAVATESEVAWAIRRFYYGEEDTEPLSQPVIETPTQNREGLFGDGSQMLSGPEEEELAELEPIPSDSQVIAENPLILARAAEAAEGDPARPDAMGAFFGDEHAPAPMQLQEIDPGAIPTATDLSIDLSAEVSARHPTRPDFLSPLLLDAAEPATEAPTSTGPAVAAELDAAFERTFALEGTEALAAEATPDVSGVPIDATPAGLSGQALQALIRILVRKGLVSEIEILDELQAELAAGQPPLGDSPLRR